MRDDPVAPGFTGSLIFHEDGSVTARYGYDCAVRLLYEYERSGVAPEDAETGRRGTSWERYTMKRTYCLTPEQWRERYGTVEENAVQTF